MIDRRTDPKADTGLFELVYRQNFPKTPPYLGMNLAVRGRKIFRMKSKSKQEKKEEKKKRDTILVGQKRREIIKNKFIPDNNILKTFPKSVKGPEAYKGPLIQDLIEELHKTFTYSDDNGIDFVPALPTISGKKEDKLDTVSDKKGTAKPKSKTNHQSSSNRKLSVKENDGEGKKLVRSRPQQLLSGWNGVKLTNFKDTWEQQTISILKGKNVFSNFPVSDTNKNFLANDDYFDLNKLLPQINEEGKVRGSDVRGNV